MPLSVDAFTAFLIATVGSPIYSKFVTRMLMSIPKCFALCLSPCLARNRHVGPEVRVMHARAGS